MRNQQKHVLDKSLFSAILSLKEVNVFYAVRVGVSRLQSPIATFAEAWALLKDEIVKLLQVGGVNSAIMEHLCWIQVNETEIIWFDDAQNIAHILGLIGEGEGFAFQSIVSLNEAMDIEPLAQELIEQWLARQALIRELGVLEEIDQIRRAIIRIHTARSISPEQVEEETKRLAVLRQDFEQLRIKYEIDRKL